MALDESGTGLDIVPNGERDPIRQTQLSRRVIQNLQTKADRIKKKRSLLEIHCEETLRVDFQKYAPNPSNRMVNDETPIYTTAEYIFFTLTHPHFSVASYLVYIIIMLAIIVSTVAFILESEPSLLEFPDGCDFMHNITFVQELITNVPDNPRVMACKPKPPVYFFYIETSTIAIFTIEYVFRLLTVGFCRNWAPNSFEPDVDTPKCKYYVYHFLTDEFNLVDMISIFPYFINLIVANAGGGDTHLEGFALTKVLRLARLFRVFKLGKHSEIAVLMFKVMAKSRQALQMLAFITLLAMVLFGSLIYYAEQGMWTGPTPEHPNGVYMRDIGFNKTAPSPFSSVVDSFWWAIVTTTTVGYGEYVPTTTAGKVIATIAMMAGILLIALPITIIGTNFNTEFILQNMTNDERNVDCSSSSTSSFEDEGVFSTEGDVKEDLEDIMRLQGISAHDPSQAPTVAAPAKGKQGLRQEYQQLTYDEVLFSLESLKLEAEERSWEIFDVIITEVRTTCSPTNVVTYDMLHQSLSIISPLIGSLANNEHANESELYNLLGDVLALFSTICVIETKKEMKKARTSEKQRQEKRMHASLKKKMASKLQGIARVKTVQSRTL